MIRMEYEIISTDEPKELVDFYNGECFEFFDEDNEENRLMIAVDVHEDTKSIYRNMRAVLDMDAFEVYYLPDDLVFEPIIVNVEGLGE